MPLVAFNFQTPVSGSPSNVLDWSEWADLVDPLRLRNRPSSFFAKFLRDSRSFGFEGGHVRSVGAKKST